MLWVIKDYIYLDNIILNLKSMFTQREYVSGPCVVSRRISPPFPHMQHCYWQQPLIILGTPTAIHNCHSHYNLHLGHCETVACVSTALLRRLSLIQLYSVDVPSYHYTARILSEQEGARNWQFRMSERAREIDTGNFINLRLHINWRAASDSLVFNIRQALLHRHWY